MTSNVSKASSTSPGPEIAVHPRTRTSHLSLSLASESSLPISTLNPSASLDEAHGSLSLEERKRVSMCMSFSLSAVRLPHFHPSKLTIALIIQIFLYINGLAEQGNSMKSRKNGQRMACCSSRSNLPSTLSVGRKDTQIPALFTPNGPRTILCLAHGCSPLKE